MCVFIKCLCIVYKMCHVSANLAHIFLHQTKVQQMYVWQSSTWVKWQNTGLIRHQLLCQN